MPMPSEQVGPCENAIAITPHDTTVFRATKKLYVGAAGQIKVDMVGTGTAVILYGLLASTTLDIAVTRVYDTDTDAGFSAGILVGLY